jgi:ubiquinone/menaquinone biosynthesis C-methylase UbiE
VSGADDSTLTAYDEAATAFAADWHGQPPPADLHAAVRKYFRKGPTADIGCGSGRDVAWLSAHGFRCVGYDASEGLLAEARRRYPDLKFVASALPELSGIEDASFENVLCETVIMHLPAAAVAAAVKRMLAILKAGGTLYLTWRVTKGADQRDERGRLYAAVDPAILRAALAGTDMLVDEEVISASSGKAIHRMIARKG